jgi:hypothetical protein
MISVKCQRKECSMSGNFLMGGLCNGCWSLLPDDVKSKILSAQKVSLAAELAEVRIALKWLEER